MQEQIIENRQSNSLFVIAPYWRSGTWVFDDPSRGLMAEPFVAGVPEILNELVEDIPGAKNGFRLLFSARPFPGFQAHYQRLRNESWGAWYKAENGKEGWLCPALFKYFPESPQELFVRAEALT